MAQIQTTERLLSEEDAERVITTACNAARTALRPVLGTSPPAYDRADRFMAGFEPVLRDMLEKLTQ